MDSFNIFDMSSIADVNMDTPDMVFQHINENVDVATFDTTHRPSIINGDTTEPPRSTSAEAFENMAAAEGVGMSALSNAYPSSIINEESTLPLHPPPPELADMMETAQPIATIELSSMTDMAQPARSVVSIGSSAEDSSQVPARQESKEQTGKSGGSQQGAASREGSMRQQTPTGQKRQAAGDLQKEPVKKVKSDVAGDGEEKETVAGLRAKANRMLEKREEVIHELKLQVARLDSQLKVLKEEAVDKDSTLAEVEDKRDEFMTKFYDIEKNQEARDANEKLREDEEKAARKAFQEQLKADKKREYDAKVLHKHKALGARYKELLSGQKAKHDETFAELSALKKMSKKEVSDLKTAHTDEVRGLREQIREANKHGAGKARDLLKVREAELKEAQATCERLRTERSSLKSRLQLEEAKVANAEGEKQQVQDNWRLQCNEVRDLEKRVTELKQQYDTQVQKYKQLQLQYHLELAELEKTRSQELQHANKRAALYHANQTQGQQNLVMQQRNTFPLRKANEKLLQEKQALELKLKEGGASQEMAKEFEAMKAKLKTCEQFAERNQDLKQMLLRNSFLDQAKQKENAA